jgi:hypothetical protein
MSAGDSIMPLVSEIAGISKIVKAIGNLLTTALQRKDQSDKIILLLSTMSKALDSIDTTLKSIDSKLEQQFNRVLGGVITQIPVGGTMIPIQPGQSPKFKVTPTFGGSPFTLDGSKAAISTSDAVNAPAAIDLTDDAQGTTFILNLTANATIAAGGEALAVDWSYTNIDGQVAHVTGTVTEQGIVDDVTGGTFEQIE